MLCSWLFQCIPSCRLSCACAAVRPRVRRVRRGAGLADGPTRSIGKGTQRATYPPRARTHAPRRRPGARDLPRAGTAARRAWKMLERHLWSSQTFVPLRAGRWVLLVARGHAPRTTWGRWRRSPARQGRRHLACGDLAPSADRAGGWQLPGDRAQGVAVDCEVVQLDVPVRIADWPRACRGSALRALPPTYKAGIARMQERRPNLVKGEPAGEPRRAHLLHAAAIRSATHQAAIAARRPDQRNAQRRTPRAAPAA